ncbi:MAG: hypothetical protein ACHQVS_02310 [Candidatus Babeliales bacterium]
MNKHMLSIFLGMVLISTMMHGMVFDNRYFPLLQRPYVTVEDQPSHFAMDLFVTTASRSFGKFEEEIGLPEIHGKFDEQGLAKAIAKTGKPNPLRSQLQFISELPYTMEGKIQSQGFALSYEQAFVDWFKAGFYLMVMRSESSIQLYQNFDSVTLEEKQELALDLGPMFNSIGINRLHAQQVGFGDIDMYVRLGYAWDYILKCRSIQAGGRFGFLAPTGVTIELNNPASVPFGGNGYKGIYGSIDAEFELKEDWKTGGLLRFSKRFGQTNTQRMVVNKEPDMFGVVTGSAHVNPGLTIVADWYASMENLREGFGARLTYTYINHREDKWHDRRSNKSVPVELGITQERSKWVASYITINAFYDFGKTALVRELNPIVMFGWDIPLSVGEAQDFVRSNKVYLGVEYNF